MKEIVWEDRAGYRHRSLVKDNGMDGSKGISLDPPDLHRMDWEAVVRSIHNSLVDAGVRDWTSLQRQQDWRGMIFSAVNRPLVALFKEEAEHGKLPAV